MSRHSKISEAAKLKAVHEYTLGRKHPNEISNELSSN